MRLLLILLALAAAGCDSAFDASGSPLLQTDGARFDAELLTDGRDRVVVRIPFVRRSPPGARSVYTGCSPPHPPGLQKWVGGEWVSVYSPDQRACLSPPFVLGRAETLAGTFGMTGFLPGQNVQPTFTGGEIAGTYRLVDEIFASADGDGRGRGLLPIEARVSNPFELF